MYNLPDDTDSINLINNKFKELLNAVKVQKGSSSSAASHTGLNVGASNNNISNFNTELRDITNTHEELKKSNFSLYKTNSRFIKITWLSSNNMRISNKSMELFPKPKHDA